MVRWKYCLMLAMLLLLRTDAKRSDEDDEEEAEDNEDEEDDEEDDGDDDDRADPVDLGSQRRTSMMVPITTTLPPSMPIRTIMKKAPLECYVCGYRSEMPLRSCLDPAKYRVHSVTCHNLEDKCFTTVVSKDKSYVAVIRGCRTACVGSSDTTCCERNRCNNQAFAVPLTQRAHQQDNTSDGIGVVAVPKKMRDAAAKTTPSNVLFFVTVLLLLQTVVKVAFV